MTNKKIKQVVWSAHLPVSFYTWNAVHSIDNNKINCIILITEYFTLLSPVLHNVIIAMFMKN